MFFITRVPRTVALMLTGAAMAMAGLVMQLITQNRFVEPTTTGTIEWAGLGLAFCIFIISCPDFSSKNDWCNRFFFYRNYDFLFIFKKS